MEHDTSIPPPQSLADRIRAIPVGASVLFDDAALQTIRSTITRVKRESVDREYTTRGVAGGTRVWRLA